MDPESPKSFQPIQYAKNRAFHEIKRLQSALRFRGHHEFTIDLPARAVRRILTRNGLGFDGEGNATWWYQSFDHRRNDRDGLTQIALKYVEGNVSRDARILITGCGTGWMLIWLARHGFRNIEGFDYLDNVVRAAQEIAALGKVDAKLWQGDGFAPALQGDYDLILVLHWLYSAWSGNYGNKKPDSSDREKLLTQFLRPYVGHMKPGSLMLLELIDAIADCLEPASDAYPIRHTAEQVSRCAESVGFSVERKMLHVRYGVLPRMLYVLRKS